METYFQNPFGAAAPRIDRIEETVRRMISDLNRIGGVCSPEPSYDVQVERINVYGTQALMANRSFVLLWRKSVPKGLLKDGSCFQKWSEEDWAFFVASVKMGSKSPFFNVVSVHGEADLAVQELVTRASARSCVPERASLAA